MDGLYRKRLYDETDSSLKLQIIREILWQYGKPTDYKYIKEYLNSITDSTIISLGNFYVKTLALPKPDSTKTINDLLDNLMSLVDSTTSYNWLGDANFINELKDNLQSARTKLSSGDSLGTAKDIKAFQDSVDNVYKDSLNSNPQFVTLEGWKFLYWNAQYILDRLPKIPVANNADESSN